MNGSSEALAPWLASSSVVASFPVPIARRGRAWWRPPRPLRESRVPLGSCRKSCHKGRVVWEFRSSSMDSSRVPVLVSSREGQIFNRRLLCFRFSHLCRTNPNNPIVREIGSDFLDSVTYRSTRWHSHRPAELHGLDVLSDSPPVIRILQRLEPLSNWFASSLRSVEDRWGALAGLCYVLCIRAIVLLCIPRPLQIVTFSVPYVVQSSKCEIVPNVSQTRAPRETREKCATHTGRIGCSKNVVLMAVNT